jgi:hypothetical protein
MRAYSVIIAREGKTQYKLFWTFKGAITVAMILKDSCDETEIVNRHTQQTIFKKIGAKETWRIGR